MDISARGTHELLLGHVPRPEKETPGEGRMHAADGHTDASLDRRIKDRTRNEIRVLFCNQRDT